jgi:hypothetical protein
MENLKNSLEKKMKDWWSGGGDIASVSLFFQSLTKNVGKEDFQFFVQT